MTLSGPFEVYFDFDNTITEFDLLDEIILRFSATDSWKEAEAAWEAGQIGSKECLERQLAQVRVSDAALGSYLSTIRTDPAFAPIVEHLRGRGIEPVIVSDSFTGIIAAVLENNGIRGLTIFANELSIDGDVPRISFPHFQSICSACANCKTSHLMHRGRAPGTRKIYVGDGRSDICPAGFCEILFAKGRLHDHYAALRPDCIRFDTLATVHSHLQRLIP